MDKLGLLKITPWTIHPELVAKPVANFIVNLNHQEDIGVAEIDARFSDTGAFCEQYQVAPALAVNCVVVKAQRSGREWYAACAILATTKADINGLVRRRLDARRVSFAPMAEAITKTNMEYGGITPLGLPQDWPIFLDRAVTQADYVVIGSGLRRSKIILPGKILAEIPNVVILEKLGVPKNPADTK